MDFTFSFDLPFSHNDKTSLGQERDARATSLASAYRFDVRGNVESQSICEETI